MFVDSVKIIVKAGNGGNGAVSFHTEKYVARGGPNGGDGGRGGDVVFRAVSNSNTLIDFQYKRKFKAENGGDGNRRNQTGASAPPLIIDVPVGTVIRDAKTGLVLLDMNEPNEERVLLRGGYGGKGNARFATPTRQTPRFATPGKRTEEAEVVLELKTIADVGLIGMPNVGKSTILSIVTSANPKIENYHFTTLSPNLGVVQKGETSFVLADIPGLIEGASQGKGLGHSFLRHIERTRMLLHVIDVSGSEGRDPIEDFETITGELSQYSDELAKRPQIIVANKTDLPGAEENLVRLQEYAAEKGIPVFAISAGTTKKLDPLLYATMKELAELPPVRHFEEEGTIQEAALSYTVEKEEENVFVVTGSRVDDILLRVNLDDHESLRNFQTMLKNTGILDDLRAQGAKDGDLIIMNDLSFDFID